MTDVFEVFEVFEVTVFTGVFNDESGKFLLIYTNGVPDYGMPIEVERLLHTKYDISSNMNTEGLYLSPSFIQAWDEYYEDVLGTLNLFCEVKLEPHDYDRHMNIIIRMRDERWEMKEHLKQI